VLTALSLFAAAGAGATQTKILLSSAQDLWQGYPDGVRVSPSGSFVPGPAFGPSVELPGLPLCAVRAGGTLWVGTAPSGDLLKVETGGKGPTVAHHFEEPLVTALALLPGGDLLVGTSTPARIYRLDSATGKCTQVAALKAEYVWALLAEPGGILAATGKPGRIFRIPEKGEPQLLLDASADHVRCLVLWKGAVWAGTSGPASLFRIEGDKAYLAFGLDQEEVAAMVVRGGDLFVGANDKAGQPPNDGKPGSAKPSGNSTLYLLAEGKPPTPVERFQTPILCAASSGGEGYVGLADGRLMVTDGQDVALLAHWENAQVTALAGGDGPPVVLTGNPNAFLRPSTGAGGRYASPVADLGGPSIFGVVSLMGSGGQVLLRAGNTPKPGPFWSGWVPSERAGSLPLARYLQWKLQLTGGNTVRGISLAYRNANRAPVFISAQVNPPGEIFVRSPSQLGDRLVREIHDKDRIFPNLALAPGQDNPPQKYFLQGFRMITWKVEDPDGDEVEMKIQFRPEGGTSWYTLARHVKDSYYDFDARGLPDGLYRIRLTADDDLSNPEGQGLSTILDLPDFRVDNTPPSIQLKPEGAGKLAVEATDNTAVEAVRASVDGQPWQTLKAVAGEEGDRSRSYVVTYPASGRHWIAVQAVDPFRNEATASWLTGP
jgi:hypothetical protein